MQKYFLPAMFTALICLNIAGCATTISRVDLLKNLQYEPPPLVVDVRSQGEYDRDHLPGAVHIQFYSIASGLKKLGAPKQRQIVLYCEHGPRASLAALTLYLFGYQRVYSLDGHMHGWRANGFPLSKMTP